jgi:RpiR family carbohydrate utilization transcriptional regulator
MKTDGDKNNNSCEVFLKISSAFEHLGKAEQQVATFIKNYPEEILKLPIDVLAEKIGVSVSTVIRLCRRIDFEGYKDFKLSLAKDLARNYKDMCLQVNSGDNLSLFLEDVQSLLLQTIHNTFKILSPAEIEKACLALTQAESILVIGTGGTAAIAKLFNHKLLVLGLNSQWSNDFTEVPLLINRMKPKDVLIALSNSGSTRAIQDSVVMAKDQGCITIALTSYSQSPVAKNSNMVFITSIQEKPTGSENGTARVAQISIIEVFCLLIGQKIQKKLE